MRFTALFYFLFFSCSIRSAGSLRLSVHLENVLRRVGSILAKFNLLRMLVCDGNDCSCPVFGSRVYSGSKLCPMPIDNVRLSFVTIYVFFSETD